MILSKIVISEHKSRQDDSVSHRILLEFDNNYQTSFWLGTGTPYNHLVESLLSTASNIVHYSAVKDESD